MQALEVFFARELRLLRREPRELPKLQHRAREHEAAMAKLRGLVALGDVQLAGFIDAVGEDGVVRKGEGIAVEIERARVERSGGGGEERGEAEETAEQGHKEGGWKDRRSHFAPKLHDHALPAHLRLAREEDRRGGLGALAAAAVVVEADLARLRVLGIAQRLGVGQEIGHEVVEAGGERAAHAGVGLARIVDALRLHHGAVAAVMPADDELRRGDRADDRHGEGDAGVAADEPGEREAAAAQPAGAAAHQLARADARAAPPGAR